MVDVQLPIIGSPAYFVGWVLTGLIIWFVGAYAFRDKP
jgi:hypothetical protein